MTSMIKKLQADALDEDVPVSRLLRYAKVIATKLDLEEALIWIDQEINGYMDLKNEDIPPYRVMTGELKAFNRFHGWQPIIIENAEIAKKLSTVHSGISLSTIERTIEDTGTSYIVYGLPPDVLQSLRKAINERTDIQLRVSYSLQCNIVEQVRNLILDWTLELEKAGILGEDMDFSIEEKGEAQKVTKNYFIQNAGVVGDVKGKAKVGIDQKVEFNIDLGQLKDFVAQGRQALPLMPDNIRNALDGELSELGEEADKKNPDTGAIKELLTSIRSMAEGASGNLAASGLLDLLKNLF